VRVTYNKLVRDRIPDIISAAGQRPVTRILDQTDYQAALLEKLTEEAHEARQAPPDQLAAELADVLEVLQAIAQAHGMTWDRILSAAAAKRSDRGAFDDRVFLELVENAD
jgi:predicted house-cleaning noncanonical NTP pyrophosphatase (MazG superfamily)